MAEPTSEMPDSHMTMTRLSNILTISAATALLSACSYDCGEKARTVATGQVRDAAGAALATATVVLSDNLNPSFLRLGVGVTGTPNSAGAPLKGHVTRARLVTDAGDLLGEIPTGTSTLAQDVVIALNVDLSSRSEYERVRAALLTMRAKVVLDTDLPGREHIETTLTDVHELPGRIQRCSPA